MLFVPTIFEEDNTLDPETKTLTADILLADRLLFILTLPLVPLTLKTLPKVLHPKPKLPWPTD